MSSKEKKMIVILLIVVAIAIGILFKVKNKNKGSIEKGDSDIWKTSGIDVNDEAYKDKKIYEKDGDIIIEGADGSKTIESKKGEPTDLKEVSTQEKEQYEITDVKIDVQGNRTSITGKVKNNGKDTRKVCVQVKFYSENRAKGSASTVIEGVKAGEAKSFDMYVMGNMKGFTHKIEVTYTN